MNNQTIYKKLLLFGLNMFILLSVSCSKDEEMYEEIAQCIEYDGEEDTYIQKEEYKEGIFMNTYCALGASTASMQWQKNVAQAVSENYKSYSIPGCRWAYAPNSSYNVSVMADELASLLKDKNENGYYPDLITIMCGINDAAGGFLGDCRNVDPIYNENISLDQWFSSSEYKPLRESVYGSIVFMIESLKINFPKSCILIMTTQQINNANFDASKLVWINRIIKSVAKSYSIPVIDVFNDSGINFSNVGLYLDDTRLHPNTEGEALLQNYVEKQVRLKYTSYNIEEETSPDKSKDITQCLEYDGKEDTYIQKEQYKEGIFMSTYCALGASTASMQWQKNVAQAVSENYKSYSIPGCRWAYAPNSSYNVSVMADELASLLKDKNENGYYPDLITIMCGINDAAGGFLGDCNDADPIYNANISVDQWLSSSEYKPLRESVYGSIVFMIESLKINFPKSCILIMTTQQINNVYFEADKLVWINRIIKSVGKSYSIPIIDVFNDSGINFSNIGLYLDDTRLHPNAEGEVLLQNYVEKQVRLKYTSCK